jgi:hypothetical protein
MIDLDLQINSYPVRLGISINNDLIKGIGLKKVGFFRRWQLKVAKGQILYWTANPTISCFELQYAIFPKISKDFSFKMFRELRRAGMVFGTSAFIWLKNHIVEKMTFQCIHNKYVAKQKLDEFREVCEKRYGPAEKQLDDLLAIWEDSNSKVISELSMSGNHSYTHWIMKRND